MKAIHFNLKLVRTKSSLSTVLMGLTLEEFGLPTIYLEAVHDFSIAFPWSVLFPEKC
jgi:hypothetical protein